MMDNNYLTVRREQHEVIGTIYEKDVHNYEVVVDLVRNLHNQVLKLGTIDPGGNNDINVLDRSPLIANFLEGHNQDMSFEVNGHRYPYYYLLADGIYPKWTIFVQTIHDPQREKRQYYAKMQEAARKDVERCFGVLQSRWGIIQNPSRQ